MLAAADRARLEELNTDHHRRMTLDHERLAKQGLAEQSIDKDARSRAAVIEAMKGCVKRFEMEHVGERFVLELGAGSGRDIEHLEQTFNATYYGVEVVKDAALKLKDRNVHHLALEDMPEDWNGRFHFIYSRHVMEHVIDVDGALTALKRVLAPNGVIGAVTPHYFPDPEPAHITQLRASEWMKLYRKHGLAVSYCTTPKSSGPTPEAHLVAMHDSWPRSDSRTP